MLPDITYIVRIECTDGSVDIWEHTPYEDAKAHYDMFDESDAEMYSRVVLIERNWNKKKDYDTTLEVKVL